MKYELDILESIIQDTVDSQGISKKQFKLWKKTVQVESGRIKKALVREVFSLQNDQCIELYIQNHQTALISLSDKVFENMDHSSGINTCENSGDPLVFNLQKLIYQQIDSILSFLKSYFGNYFNHNDKIPEQYRLVAQKELREQNRLLYHQLKSEKNCPLLDIAFYPIKQFHESDKAISFQRLIYLKELIQVINHSCLSCSGDTINCTLKTNLIYLNFNNYRFFSFLTQEITREYI